MRNVNGNIIDISPSCNLVFPCLGLRSKDQGLLSGLGLRCGNGFKFWGLGFQLLNRKLGVQGFGGVALEVHGLGSAVEGFV